MRAQRRQTAPDRGHVRAVLRAADGCGGGTKDENGVALGHLGPRANGGSRNWLALCCGTVSGT